MIQKYLLGAIVTLVLGQAMPVSASTSVSNLIQITGNGAQDQFGLQTEKCDLNADGKEDLIVGSYYMFVSGIQTGAVHIVYGSDGTVSAGTAASVADVVYTGEAQYDYAGISLDCGDINADGYGDLLIGAMQNNAGGINGTGAAYLIYGQPEQLPGGNLSTAIKLANTIANEFIAYDVAMVGDLNGDSFGDMVVGSSFNDNLENNGGAVYLLYGKAAAFTSGTLTSNATIIYGDAPNDRFGSKVSPAGDVNGDGFNDAIIGASGVDSPGLDTGAVYLLYGSNTTLPNPMTASQLVRLTGETAGDGVGYEAIGAGDVDADGYADIIVGAPSYGASNEGAVYLLYGQPAQFTAGLLSQGVRFTGVTMNDNFGTTIGYADDLNQDGYDDLLFSAQYADQPSDAAGSVYLVPGQANRYSNAVITAVATSIFTGADASEQLGHGVLGVDLNGDQYPELIMGATYNADAGSLAGALYLGYLRYDLDEDGVLGAGGLLETGTDCNDQDTTVSTDQTYYLDEDGDGLGLADETTTLCVGTAPDGYANNANDTDDTIQNNGIEIGGDDVDNDGDGEVDEVNTVANNGRHPGIKNVDPLNRHAVDAAIVNVRSTKQGKLRVRYADDSVYVYKVFKGTQPGKLVFKRYPHTGYYAVLQKTGTRIAVVNALTGKKKITAQNLPGPTYTKHDLQFSDLRSNGKQDLIVASKQGDAVRLYITEVNLTKAKLKYGTISGLNLPGIQLNRTTVVGNTIDLRSKRQPLANFFVNSQHQLIQL